MPASRRAVERVRQAALARRGARDLVGTRATDVVQVLGDVGEVREVAERPHHDHRVLGTQPVEDVLEFGAGRRVVVAAEGDRAATDALDGLERCPRLPARARCRRAGGRAGGCPRGAGAPCRRGRSSGGPRRSACTDHTVRRPPVQPRPVPASGVERALASLEVEQELLAPDAAAVAAQLARRRSPRGGRESRSRCGSCRWPCPRRASHPTGPMRVATSRYDQVSP